MTFRKRKNPSPSFRLPPSFNPLTGQTAAMQSVGLWPYCALMQVAATDDKANYVLCRGFDTRIGRFIDYESGNANKPGIPVAKPYGSRTTGAYTVGEIHAAFLPVQGPSSSGDTTRSFNYTPPSSTDFSSLRLGQNPGKASSSSGHPADLTEDLASLETTGGVKINWMFVSESTTVRVIRGMVTADVDSIDATFTVDNIVVLSGSTPASPATVSNVMGFKIDNNQWAQAIWNNATNQYECIQAQCGTHVGNSASSSPSSSTSGSPSSSPSAT